MKKALAKAQAGTYKHFALTQAIAALSSGGGYGFGGFGNAYRRPMFACTCVALCVSGLHELCVAPSTRSMFEIIAQMRSAATTRRMLGSKSLA